MLAVHWRNLVNGLELKTHEERNAKVHQQPTTRPLKKRPNIVSRAASVSMSRAPVATHPHHQAATVGTKALIPTVGQVQAVIPAQQAARAALQAKATHTKRRVQDAKRNVSIRPAPMLSDQAVRSHDIARPKIDTNDPNSMANPTRMSKSTATMPRTTYDNTVTATRKQ